jgi:hypothetical protein
MIGMGNLSLMVNLFRARKSRHMRKVPFFLRPSPLVKNMGWYYGELPPSLVIPVPYFLSHFYEKMDICKDVHLGVDFPEGEGCYDHAHPWREVIMWEPKIPWGTCPR